MRYKYRLKKIPGRVHLVVDGKTLCQIENNKLRKDWIEAPEPREDAPICKLCLGLQKEADDGKADLS